MYGGTGDDLLDGQAGDDTAYGGDGNDRIYGRDGVDRLYGELGNDTIYTGNGYDTARGGGGADTLYGEEGNDLLYGDDGNDRLYGGFGGDTLYGGNNDDLLDGGPAGDALWGGYGNDRLYGGSGNDTLRGEYGNDIIDGGSGTNYLYGGDGTDTFYVSYLTDGLQDTVSGGTGFNTLSFANSTTAVRVAAPFETDISFYDSNGGLAGTASGIQKIVGTPYADSFWHADTWAEPPALYGGGGNDQWAGLGTFYGDAGNDRIQPMRGAIVSGGSGYDDFHLFFSVDESEFMAGGIVIRDFQPGIDDIFFDVNGDGHLTKSGDVYTMHWFDEWNEAPAQASFQIVGITNLSPSDYVWV